jgi:anti-sigma B factor antagonist
VLVKTLKRVREHDGGSLAVVVTADRVAKVFRLTGLDTLIPLHPTVESAVAG